MENFNERKEFSSEELLDNLKRTLSNEQQLFVELPPETLTIIIRDFFAALGKAREEKFGKNKK